MTAQSDAFELLGAARKGDFIILCDHASNHIPPTINHGDLGICKTDMQRHIAYDIGAADLSQRLGQILDSPVLLSKFSRLVIDPNRGEDDPTLIMQLYDGTIIPANRHLNAQQRDERLQHYHRPYRKAAMELTQRHPNAITIALHSFTPQLRGRNKRPWEIGILFAHDTRASDPLIAALEAQTNFCIGRNQPYNGALAGDMMDVIALQQNRLHVLIEIRNDLIKDSKGQDRFAKILAKALVAVKAQL